MSEYPSMGETGLSQAGSSSSSCLCEDGGSKDRVRSLISDYKHRHQPHDSVLKQSNSKTVKL